MVAGGGGYRRGVLGMLAARVLGLLWKRCCGVCVKTSVATLTGMSDVGDVALVEVVGSSSACPWDCHGLLVAVKLKLRWRGLGGVR